MFAPPIKRPAAAGAAPRKPAATSASGPAGPAVAGAALDSTRVSLLQRQSEGPAEPAQDLRLEREADQAADEIAPRFVGEDRPRPPTPLPPLAPPGGGASPVRPALRSPGQPLSGPIRQAFEGGFGRDLAAVRIHAGADADAAARSLGALAFTHGRDIAFRTGRYAPDSTAGRTLLAHELAHVVQQQGAAPRLQLKGDPDEKPKKKKQPPAARKYFSVTVTEKLSTDQLLVAFVKQYLGVGQEEAAQIAKHWSWGTKDVPEVTQADVDAKSYVVDITHVSVPKRSAAQSKGGDGAGSGKQQEPVTDPKAGKDEAARKRQAIDALPDDVSQFLFGGGAPAVEPRDYQTVLDIAAKIAAMTSAERAEYKSRTTEGTVDWKAYKKSIDQFLTELGERKAEEAERKGMAARFSGLDTLYERYRDHLVPVPHINLSPSLGGGSTGPTRAEIEEGKVLEADLVAAGFPGGIQEFGSSIEAYEKAFAKEAARQLEISLDQYLHRLQQEKARYETPGAAEQLAEALGKTDAAADFDTAQNFALLSALAGANPVFGLMGEQAEALGRTKVIAATPGHPLVHQPGFDLDALTHAPRDQVKRLVLADIRNREQDIARIRAKLNDPSLFFGNDEMFEAALKAQRIPGQPVLEKILRDHKDDLFWEDVLEGVGLAVLGIVLGILSGGTGFVAVGATLASAGLETASIVNEISDFNDATSMYDLGLVEEPPSPVSVVLAVGGGLVELKELGEIVPVLQKLMKPKTLLKGASKLDAVNLPTLKSPVEATEATGAGKKLTKQAGDAEETVLPGTLSQRPLDSPPLPTLVTRKSPDGKLKKRDKPRISRKKKKELKKRQAQQTASTLKKGAAGTVESTAGKTPNLDADAVLEKTGEVGEAKNLPVEIVKEIGKEALGHVGDALEAIADDTGSERSRDEVREADEIIARGEQLGLSAEEALDFVALRRSGTPAADVEAAMKVAAALKQAALAEGSVKALDSSATKGSGETDATKPPAKKKKRKKRKKKGPAD